MEFGWGYVNEILALLKPEPATERELDAAAGISDVDYAIYSEWLQIICDEAKEMFIRSGRSNFLLAGDLVVGLYTAQGDLVCAMTGSYVHFVTGIPPIKYIMRHWKDDPAVGVNDGDVFFNNDSLFGAFHTIDEAVVMPVFGKGELIAWGCAAVHEGDVGCGPGPAMPGNCKNRFDEGLKSPPIKIGENYQLRQDLVNMMGNMTRSPETHEVDLRARAAGCERVRTRVQQLANEKGNDFVIGLMRRMLMETERGAREKIRSWNDGKYRSVTFRDILNERQYLTKWGMTLIKEDDHLTVDFSECSPENEGSTHMFAHQVVGCFIHPLYWGIWSTLPLSSGVFAAIDFVFKPGSVYHASPWASTLNGPLPGAWVFNLVFCCSAKMVYASEQDRPMLLAGYGSPSCYVFAGLNQWGVMLADLETIGTNTGGGGARYDRDGIDTFGFGYCPWGIAPDAEEVEAEKPWLWLYYSHGKDGGGYGKYRGGCGIHLAHLQHHTPWLAVGSIEGGRKIAQSAHSLFGGYPATLGQTMKVKNTDVFERMSKGDIVTPRGHQELFREKAIRGEYEVIRPETAHAAPLMRGDIYAVIVTGGGSYGDVLEREPASVMKDIRDEIISHWTAQNVYKVAYDPDTLEVDYQKTEELRQLEREERKKRGKKYDEFEKEWLTRRPPEKALEWFGSWPDANPTRTVIRI